MSNELRIKIGDKTYLSASNFFGEHLIEIDGVETKVFVGQTSADKIIEKLSFDKDWMDWMKSEKEYVAIKREFESPLKFETVKCSRCSNGCKWPKGQDIECAICESCFDNIIKFKTSKTIEEKLKEIK